MLTRFRATALGRLFHCSKGSAAIELALLTPFFFLIMYAGAELSYQHRLENRLHRGTASLADILANQLLYKSETLSKRVEKVMGDAVVILSHMINDAAAGDADRANVEVGLVVSVFNTVTGKGVTYTEGIECTEEPLFSEGSDDADLIAPENFGSLELLQVTACVKQEKYSFRNMVFPTSLRSSFTTLRKEW